MANLDLHATVTLNNGVEMPKLGLGVWKASQEDAEESVRTAIENGYILIDTAKAYGNEEAVRKGIEAGLKATGKKREDLFITTKLANEDQGYDSALENFEGSLERLGIDYLDLYLIHWPVTGKYKESWKALEKLYAEKKVRAIGVCNFDIETMEDLLTDAKVVPAVDQVELHPLLQQPELREYLADKGIHLEAWSPLGGGQVLGNKNLAKIAARYNKSVAQLIIRWGLQLGFTTIPKSVHEERIIENADVFDFEISEADLKEIEKLDENYRSSFWVTSFDWYNMK